MLWQERHGNRVTQSRGQLVTAFICDLAHELIGHLHQHARTVTRVRVTTARASVRQVMKNLDAVGDHLVTHNTLDIRYHSDATGIVLLVRVVEPVLRDMSEVRALSLDGRGDLATAFA